MVNICLVKAWNAIDRLLIIWKSDLSDKSKWDFFQAVTVSVLLYECTIKMLTKLHKNAACSLEQILEVIPHKTVTGLPSHKPLKMRSKDEHISNCNILTNKREITSDATGVTAPTTSGGFGQ